MSDHTSFTGQRSRTPSRSAVAALTGIALTLATAGAAHAATTPIAYVANNASQTVSEINVGTGTVTNTVSTDLKHGIGTDPEFEVTAPDGKTVWVENAISGNLTVIDTLTHQAVDMVHVCTVPNNVYPLVFTPDGSHAYMICNGNSASGAHLFDINTSTRKATEIPAVVKPLNLATSPDSSRLYVTSQKSLVVIDTATDAVAASITLPGVVTRTFGKAIVTSKDGTRVYVGLAKGVAVVNAATNSVTTTIPLTGSASEIGLSADGSKLVAIDDRGGTKARVISTLTNAVTSTIALGANIADAQLAMSPTDSSTAYLEDQHSKAKNPYRIVSIDIATGTFSEIAALKSPSYFIDVAPDGRTVYASASETSTLLAIDARTGSASRIPVQQNMGDVVFADQGRQAYVLTGSFFAGLTPGEVWVLDTRTYKTIASVEPVKQAPDQLVATPNGKTVYIAGRGEIVALDTATGTTTGIPLADGPGALAVSPDGADLYATDSVNGTIYVISTAADQVISSFRVPNSPNSAIFDPRAIAFSPDGTKLYVTDARAISVVDTADDNVSTTITLGATAWAIAVSPNGELVYASLWETGGTAGTVAMIDAATGAVSKVTVGDGPYGLSFTPDGSEAYVANCRGASVSIIGTATGTVTGTVAVGSNPRTVEFTPDGSEAYVPNLDGGSVSVISTATGTVSGTIAVGSDPEDVAIAP